MDPKMVIKQELRNAKEREQLVTIYTNPLIIKDATVELVLMDGATLTKDTTVYTVSLDHVVAIEVSKTPVKTRLNI